MNITTHKNQIRIYAEDVDFMGIVYHANYLRYLERSRTELLRAYNLPLSELYKVDVLFAISELAIKYRAPARMDDLLTVETSRIKLKSCSLTFAQRIVNERNELICEAEVKVVCVNKNLKPQRLPDIIGG